MYGDDRSLWHKLRQDYDRLGPPKTVVHIKADIKWQKVRDGVSPICNRGSSFFNNTRFADSLYQMIWFTNKIVVNIGMLRDVVTETRSSRVIRYTEYSFFSKKGGFTLVWLLLFDLNSNETHIVSFCSSRPNTKIRSGQMVTLNYHP